MNNHTLLEWTVLALIVMEGYDEFAKRWRDRADKAESEGRTFKAGWIHVMLILDSIMYIAGTFITLFYLYRFITT